MVSKRGSVSANACSPSVLISFDQRHVTASEGHASAWIYMDTGSKGEHNSLKALLHAAACKRRLERAYACERWLRGS